MTLDLKFVDKPLFNRALFVIELPKFRKNKEELSSIEEKWCYFFKHAHETNEV